MRICIPFHLAWPAVEGGLQVIHTFPTPYHFFHDPTGSQLTVPRGCPASLPFLYDIVGASHPPARITGPDSALDSLYDLRRCPDTCSRAIVLLFPFSFLDSRPYSTMFLVCVSSSSEILLMNCIMPRYLLLPLQSQHSALSQANAFVCHGRAFRMPHS